MPLRLTQVQHWAKTAQTDHVTLRPWPLTLDVMAPMADAGRRPPSVYQVRSSQALAYSEDMAHDVCQHGPVNLTFDRLTLKLVCESHLSWGTFLPNLGTLDLWVRYVRDRRTDKSNAYCRLPYWSGGITASCVLHMMMLLDKYCKNQDGIVCRDFWINHSLQWNWRFTVSSLFVVVIIRWSVHHRSVLTLTFSSCNCFQLQACISRNKWVNEKVPVACPEN